MDLLKKMKADENHELNPLSLYAQDKVKAERFLIKLQMHLIMIL